MAWISIKEKLPEDKQKVDIWVEKNGEWFREVDCEFIKSIDFHKIPGFRKISMHEIVYYLEDNCVIGWREIPEFILM